MRIKSLSKLKNSFSAEYAVYFIIVVSMYLLFFEEAAARYDILIPSVFRNLLPMGAAILFIRELSFAEKPSRLLLSPYIVFGLLFSIFGMTGFILFRYQSFGITVRALFGHLRFWVCLYFFIRCGQMLDMRRRAKRLFGHTAFLAITLCALSYIDFFAHIWPRQIYRYGIGSIQLFFGHPSNLGARSVFLIAMLCVLRPSLSSEDSGKTRRQTACTVLIFCLLLVTLMTLRFRLFGWVAFFLVLYLYMLAIQKELNTPVILAGAAAALLIGGRRLYTYYFSPAATTMARGQMALKSLYIARDHFPFGSGFGTFGSRHAQIYYSPLYYRYHLTNVAGLSPEHSNYACDTFFPAILAESGWFGFAAYLGLILTLLISVLKEVRQAGRLHLSPYPGFAAIILIAYELVETTGTLAFSETYSSLIALALGLAIAALRSSSPDLK